MATVRTGTTDMALGLANLARMSDYKPADTRYDTTDGWFRRCGRSGLKLPAISLGCWHNFGGAGTDAAKHDDEAAMHANAQQMLFAAFDHGVTHFDLANNYGPPPGTAEQRVGRILAEDFKGYRDELIISSKAGFGHWPGPYGDHGSRKYLMASLDQSLARLRLDYVDIFYHHRPNPETPLEETLGALHDIVKAGKALYCGISNYRGGTTQQVVEVCDREGFVRPVIHQPNYSMFNRWVEDDLLSITTPAGIGTIAFCPLAQGLLTPKYLGGDIPDDSRAAQKAGFLKKDGVTDERLAKVKALRAVAEDRGQSINQLALSWVLRDQGPEKGAITTALIGASRPSQIVDNIPAAEKLAFSDEELKRIDAILAG